MYLYLYLYTHVTGGTCFWSHRKLLKLWNPSLCSVTSLSSPSALCWASNYDSPNTSPISGLSTFQKLHFGQRWTPHCPLHHWSHEALCLFVYFIIDILNTQIKTIITWTTSNYKPRLLTLGHTPYLRRDMICDVTGLFSSLWFHRLLMFIVNTENTPTSQSDDIVVARTFRYLLASQLQC